MEKISEKDLTDYLSFLFVPSKMGAEEPQSGESEDHSIEGLGRFHAD